MIHSTEICNNTHISQRPGPYLVNILGNLAIHISLSLIWLAHKIYSMDMFDRNSLLKHTEYPWIYSHLPLAQPTIMIHT